MRSSKHNANHAQPPAKADGEGLPRWLTVEQIRKLQRMRRENVVEAMESGELPYERRGRIRYARLTDVLAWEERRLKPEAKPCSANIHSSLLDLA
ncbi:MAG: helix-turn-helix domain-containing protein [Pirellulales bacterium]|nr:helix-turn-helix domain-containing protein [Pirellulales bacterium]